MSVQSIYEWHDGKLVGVEYCDMTETSVVAADSWLVVDSQVLALDAHLNRFLAAASGHSSLDSELVSFWEASLALIPREGDWFPRVELQSRADGGYRLVFRLRSAPERTRSLVLATWTGADPRTMPLVKGPDLERLLGVRTSVQKLGADEAVILTPDGYVVEAAYSALLWWRGEILCGPPSEFERVRSVTAGTVLALATALGVDTHDEAVTPGELDGTELWAVNALQGIRIATRWVDGPALAEKPGRLTQWRTRLDALRRPIPTVAF